MSKVITETLQWSVKNFEWLDNESQEAVDELLKLMREGARSLVETMPDNPLSRQFRRIASGDHLMAKSLVNTLVGDTKQPPELVAMPADAFLSILQHMLDVLFDATRLSHSGETDIPNLGLSYSAVDELIVGFYLAQRAFVGQAYSHIRSVYEIVDKLELFHKQPEWIKLWASGDEKKIWKELRPAAVRTKLGNPKNDPLYSFFSSLGPHGTFESVQVRMVKQVKIDTPDERMKVRISVGGHTPFKHHIAFVNTFCAFAAMSLLGTIATIFSEHMNEEEIEGKLGNAAQTFESLIENYFLKWLESEGIPTNEIVKELKQKPWRQIQKGQSARPDTRE